MKYIEEENMSSLTKIACIVVLASLLVSCQPIVTPTPTLAPTSGTTVEVVTATPASTATTAVPTAELPTVTSLPTDPAAPTATSLVPSSALPDYSSNAYLDDRSTAAALMLSYVNAINRHEYLRAYSYWLTPSSYLGTLDAFTNAYANVTSELVTMAAISGDGAAGSVYYSFPAVFTDTLSGGSTSKYAGCFVMRLPQPANYGEPPIQPMNIDRGSKTAISASTSDSDALASACSSSDYPTGQTVAGSVESLSDLSNSNYIDNRSGALEVISSLLNAINRKEYVRAYSYWENPATTVGNYDNFAAGYNDTGTVTATFGTITSDAGAGQFHYQIPVAMKVITTTNTQQTFVGCYTLHLANPGVQGTLPFQPLAITVGKFKSVSNSTDVTPLLATACN
jgi:hypothetical protein